MSQIVYKITVEEELYPEVLGYHPDAEECENIVKDMIEEGYISPTYNDIYTVHATWYEVGEGESDTGEAILSDEEILELFKNDTFEEELDKRGIEYMIIESSYDSYYCE